MDYSSEEVIARNGNSGLHVVLVFHTTEAREMLLEDLVLPLSDKNKQLAFVLVDRCVAWDANVVIFFFLPITGRSFLMLLEPITFLTMYRNVT